MVGQGQFSVSTSKSFPLRFNIVQSIIEKKRFSSRLCEATSRGRLLNYFLLELSGKFKPKRINSNPIQRIEEQKSKLYENRMRLR